MNPQSPPKDNGSQSPQNGSEARQTGSDSQRLLADSSGPSLDQANEIRVHRANLLKAISAGEADPAYIVVNESPGITFIQLLRALPRVGKHRASVILESLDLGENLRLGDPSHNRQDLRNATQRERQVMADWVTDYCERAAA